MSDYYRGKRTRNIYDPNSTEPYKISRSKIELFMNCPRCFYIDRRKGVGQPPGYPFNLNSAVDSLLKTEFDHYRKLKQSHPLMVDNNIDAIPFEHPELDNWRNSLSKGIRYHEKATNLIITGGVDDVWVRPNGELIIVDYKATAKKGDVTLDAEWQIGYKRQMEIYQWLFKKNGFQVSDIGYFVYCNGNANESKFGNALSFRVSVIPYEGNSNWVESSIAALHKCLQENEIPNPAPSCDHCVYIQEMAKFID